MKKTFTQLCLAFIAVFAFSNMAMGQINAGSPIPVDFLVTSPATIAAEYDYAAQTDTWGPQLDHTVAGELVWAYDVDGDSLNCEDVVTDLTGKFALIRRGACFFSQKVWNVQQRGAIGAIICNHYDDATQDENSLVGMSPASEAPWDSLALEVTIPAVFASRLTCETITSELDNGTPVEVAFEVRAFLDPVAAYSYHTPIDEAVPLEDMGISFFNLDTNVLPEITINLDITDPSGNTTSLSQTEMDLDPLTAFFLGFDDSYTPDQIGEYNLHFSNSLTDEEFDRKFVITEHTYAMDNDDIFDWIATTDQGFVDDGFRYDFGNFYVTNETEQTAVAVTFQLANPDVLFTDDPDADLFEIRIYDADPDGNGEVPPDADSYDALDETGGGAVIVGFANYVLTEDVQPYDMITVEMEDPVTLEPNKIYLVMVQYNGLNAGLGVPPWYTWGGTEAVAGFGSAVFTDRLYTGGWSGGWKGVIRLHLDGFLTSAEEVLDESKLTLSPNPATTEVRLDLALEEVADQVEVRIMDFQGRLVSMDQFENLQEATLTFDVSDLATGNYFMSVTTPEGARAKKFQVIK